MANQYHWIALAIVIVFASGASSKTLADVAERVGKLEGNYVSIALTLGRLEDKINSLCLKSKACVVKP